MSYADCKPGDPCWDLGYIFNDVLPPNTILGMEELYGCGINPYSFIDCNILTGCTSVLSGLTGPMIPQLDVLLFIDKVVLPLVHVVF